MSTSVNVDALPLGRLRDDVARRARRSAVTMARRDAGDPVEQRGLADVRPADEHDDGRAPSHGALSRPAMSANRINVTGGPSALTA